MSLPPALGSQPSRWAQGFAQTLRGAMRGLCIGSAIILAVQPVPPAGHPWYWYLVWWILVFLGCAFEVEVDVR